MADKKFKVLVQFPDGECGEIETYASQSIRQFKNNIEQSYGRAYVTNKLTLEERELENDNSIAYYKIQQDSFLIAQMQIYVYFLSKKGFLLDVDPDVSIAEVKIMIESKDQDFPMFNQRIFLEGNNLENEMTLSQCDITDSANLFVLVREDHAPPDDGRVQIYVKSDEKIHILDVAPTDTIAVVKSKLCALERVTPDCQRLSFCGQDLENQSQALWEYGVNRECLLHLVCRQDPEGGNTRTHHIEPEIIDLHEHRQSAQGDSDTQHEEKITIFLMNENNPDGIPFEMNKSTTTLRQVFYEYSNRVNIPTSDLQFIYGDYGQLPSECDFTADQIGITEGDIILVNHMAPPQSFMPHHMMNREPFESPEPILDLTAFSAGSNSVERNIVITLRGIGKETRAKIDYRATTLQLAFSSFADNTHVNPASLVYVCKARRLSHDAEETAFLCGINDGDTIHAILKKESSFSIPGNGKTNLYLLEIGKPESEKEYFGVDVNVRLGRILEAFASRKGIELSELRFLYQGKVLYADSNDDTTPAQLGICEGDIVHAIKKPTPSTLNLPPLTPDAVNTIARMSPERIFEPVVQVLNLDMSAMELVISDGKNTLSIPFNARLKRLIDSKVINKFSIIWALDISVEISGDFHTITLVDAEEAAPNPGLAIGAPTSEYPLPAVISNETLQKQERRLKKGLPWLPTCHNKNCHSVSDNLNHCSRCRFFGYCSKECQSQSWKENHKHECNYYEAYYRFIYEAYDDFIKTVGDNESGDESNDEEEMEIADVLSFWTSDRMEEMRSSKKPLTRDVAASICNSFLYCAYGLVKENTHTWMAKAYILNAAFMRQLCCPDTTIEDMVDRYDILPVALSRFFERVPYLKDGYDHLLDRSSMMAYLEDNSAYDQRIAGSRVLEGEVFVAIKASSPAVQEFSFHCGISQDISSHLLLYIKETDLPLNRFRFTFEREDGTIVSISPKSPTKPTEVGMISRGEYTIRVAILDAKERHAQKVIANFVSRRLRLRKVRKILARNIIADVVWRYRERKARRAIAEFIWHHHQQLKAQKSIADFIWQRIALRRRRQLRDSATIIQKLHRGHSTRKIYLGPLQQRLEEFRHFSAIWKTTIERVPTSVQTLSGWALVRERIDVKTVELMDEDGNLAETDKKLSKALNSALNDSGDKDGIEEEEFGEEFNEMAIDENNAHMSENLTKIDWSQFQVTAHVVKFIRNGDAKYREIFVKKMKQLAKGERSHKLQKPLKGCESIIYETYLENKSGFRILWTQEDETLVVWFIAKHKSVSRLAKLIDDAKSRTARQHLPENFVTELENDNPSTHITKKSEVLLDALGNVPLKLYDVNFDSIDSIVQKSWTPQMHLTEEERKVVEAKGTVLLLGRSGTGKTVCICNRIEFDRQRLGHKPNFTQLFISRSSALCVYVEGTVGSHKGLSFTTFDKLVRNLESNLSQEINGSFHPRKHVDFGRFKQEFYAERFPQEKISALIVWKAIRTFLKGSIEAFQTPTGLLAKEYFTGGKLGKNRCKVPSGMRESIYDILGQYQLWIKEQHLWDDCDRTMALLKDIEEAKKSNPSLYEEKIKRSRLYVDEVQDYTQIEILLFFYVGGGPGSLFLAGDPAQSVVEGTDFRFEEVRSVGYFVAGERRHLIPEKPKVVNINFRSHSGVLNCAGGFLDLLFDYFPGSAKQLKKDFGLFKGARPGVFHNVQVQQLSSLLREKMPGAVVLTHDESASRWKKMLGHPLVYGIREAKGLEFKSVIILDFFAELPSPLQKPWRNLLLNREGPDFELRYPLVETHLKLVYTAVTRCIEQLFFAETSSSAAGDAAVRWLTTTTPTTNGEQGNVDVLATSNNVADLESMIMTNDEFCIVGIDNAELATSSEIELWQATSYLDRAIYCFQKAQSSELEAKARAHYGSVKLREKLVQIAPSMSNGDREKIEEETAQVLDLLLKEDLLAECMNLLNLITPVVSPYTQQKLEENFISKMMTF